MRESVHSENLVNTISQKLMKEISPNFGTDVFAFLDVLSECIGFNVLPDT